MKKTILAVLLLATSNIFAKDFNPNGKLDCSTSFGRYNETQKFTILIKKPNKKRDIQFHTLNALAIDACSNVENGTLLCGYNGYSIIVELGSPQEVFDNFLDQLKGYRVDGTIDTFWRSQASINCTQYF